MSNWTFSVRQDGLTVASGSAPTEDACRREAGHYAAMYGQDGPLAVLVRRTRGTMAKPRQARSKATVIDC